MYKKQYFLPCPKPVPSMAAGFMVQKPCELLSGHNGQCQPALDTTAPVNV